MTTLTADILSLNALPTWMAPSARRAGADRTLLGQTILAVDTLNLTLYDVIGSYRTTDPLLWDGSQSAETAFLSRYQPVLSKLRRLENGATETDAARVNRLLALEMVRSCPTKGTNWTSGWALTAALGRANIADVLPTATVSAPMGGPTTVEGEVFIPSLEGWNTEVLPFDGTTPEIAPIRTVLRSATFQIGARPLVFRSRARRFGGVDIPMRGRFSPWSRAGIPSALPDSIQAIPTTNTLAPGSAVSDYAHALSPARADAADETLVVSRPGYGPNRDGGINAIPGAVARDTVILGLQSATPVVIRTPADASLRGDPELRVPGDAVPSPLWRGIAVFAVRPSWRQAETMTPAERGVPLDLDRDTTTFDAAPAAEPAYGSGDSDLSELRYDHALASDFA